MEWLLMRETGRIFPTNNAHKLPSKAVDGNIL